MRAFVIALLLAAAPLLAHPPVSVVVDAEGNLYYSDLARVWRVAPDGTKSVAVPNVHTHELWLDADGMLYGEDLRHERNQWSHAVWKRSAKGHVSWVIARRAGFLTNYSFVRDAAGNMYSASDDRKTLRRRARDGRVTTLARGFREIRWIHATPRGTVFFVDHGAVYRVSDGKLTQLARGLGEERHALMGLWSDRAENVFVADHAKREVKRITSRGEVKVVAKSPAPWAPTGGAIGPRGELILLEASTSNEIRVRRY